ncbi:unnamed protein product [Cuscuta epithymum]|uniref:Uncharacterized protein n=1 Tax=Cuscuta epithymum TaxID=186058 RepID=A0AAV0EKL0_9ASTE|nr:unnamed protein product [Cuscuta epithymum]
MNICPHTQPIKGIRTGVAISIMTQKAELVIVPAPLVGHIVSIVELAKLLLDRDHRLSITVLIIRHPLDPIANTVVQAVLSADSRIRLLHLPEIEPPPAELLKCPENFITTYIKSLMPHVKHSIINNVLSSNPVDTPLAGIVFDLFCSSVVDVANELGVPSYLFYTSGAAFLGLNLYFPVMKKECTLSDPDSVVSTFSCPVPARVLPTFAFVEEGFKSFAYSGRKFREAKGMIINTFEELEPYAIKALASDPDLPPVYAVGPMLSPQDHHNGKEEILDWLSQQPPSSVVFLCFGSQGGFEAPQIHQIAEALERSGHRFLWSIRRPQSLNKAEVAGELSDLDGILPEGFAERTRERGGGVRVGPADRSSGAQSHGGVCVTLRLELHTREREARRSDRDVADVRGAADERVPAGEGVGGGGGADGGLPEDAGCGEGDHGR